MPYSYDENQYHIGIKKGDIGEFVILPGNPKRVKKIAKFLDNPVKVGDCREFVTYTGYLEGLKISICSTGIGGPSAAIALEELQRIGGKYFIRLGTCGGIDIDVKSGDIVIATGAIRMDGTSKEYVPIEYPAIADHFLTHNLIKASKIIGHTAHIGIVQCKDSFYGQHSPEIQPISYKLTNKWEAWKRLKVKASEMESATLFTVADVIGVRCASILTVLGNQERQRCGLDNTLCDEITPSIKIALLAMKITYENMEK